MAEESLLFVESLIQQMEPSIENKELAVQQLVEMVGYLVNEQKYEVLVCRPF